MIRDKILFPITFLSLTSLPLAAGAQEAGSNIRGCLDSVGAYLTERRIELDGKPRVDRGLIAITNGGHAFVTDSAEGGIKGYQPFSDGRGAWQCLGNEDGKDKLKIMVWDFTTTQDADTDRFLARVTTEAVTDTGNNTISGTSLVEFLPIDAAPDSTDTVSASVTYDFTGVRLSVSE